MNLKLINKIKKIKAPYYDVCRTFCFAGKDSLTQVSYAFKKYQQNISYQHRLWC